MPTILTVDDEEGIRSFLADVLTGAGHDVTEAPDGATALERLTDQPFDVMILDLRMPGPLGGMDVLRRARAEWPALQIIVLTAEATIQTAVEAVKLGAFDYLQKPIASPDELRRLVTRALNWRPSTGAGAPLPERALRAASGGVPSDADAVPDRRGSRLVRFLWQLKRRHVYKVAATYAVSAFLGLQGAELLLPALPLPDWSYTALVIAVLAGFPIALGLGWIFDMTATGIKRTDP